MLYRTQVLGKCLGTGSFLADSARTFYVNASGGMQMGIEPASVLCLGKMWRKAFPARDSENGALRHPNTL